MSPTFSPLYRQIKDLLLEGLRKGEWGPGEPIPSEVELAVRFRVSQGTVRKAIDELAAENLVVRTRASPSPRNASCSNSAARGRRSNWRSFSRSGPAIRS